MNIAGRAPAPVEGNLERLTRLELALRAWKALVLPLHHSRIALRRLCQYPVVRVQRFLMARRRHGPIIACNPFVMSILLDVRLMHWPSGPGDGLTGLLPLY